MPNLEGFTFTSSQKRGTFFLICLILVGIFTTISLKFTADEELADQFENDQLFAPPVFQKDTLIRLDVNLANSSQLAELRGIGPVLSKRIINYRNSLGGFTDVNDISNVYGLSAETFESIKPHLYINTYTSPRKNKNQRVVENQPSYSIDINLATARELEQLPGIGKALSNRIIKYRNVIGGFDKIEQLKRVYYLEPDVFEKIAPMIYVNQSSRIPQTIAKAAETNSNPPPSESSSPDQLEITDLLASADRGDAENEPLTRGAEPENKNTATSDLSQVPRILDLNKADEKLLETLPGIDASLASRIVKFRSLLSFYVDVNQLEFVYGLSPEKLEQIKPYLVVENIEKYPLKDINQAKARNLGYYPFMSKELAESVVSYRRKIGRFDTWEEVIKVNGMTDQILAQLQYYFEL